MSIFNLTLHSEVSSLPARQMYLPSSGVTWKFSKLHFQSGICNNSWLHPAQCSQLMEVRYEECFNVFSRSGGWQAGPHGEPEISDNWGIIIIMVRSSYNSLWRALRNDKFLRVEMTICLYSIWTSRTATDLVCARFCLKYLQSGFGQHWKSIRIGPCHCRWLDPSFLSFLRREAAASWDEFFCCHYLPSSGAGR